MGYKNRVVMALEEAMVRLKQAKDMIDTEAFPEEFDTAKFVVRVAEAAGNVNFVLHEAGECMVSPAPKPDP